MRYKMFASKNVRYSISISKLEYLIFKLSLRLTTLHYLDLRHFVKITDMRQNRRFDWFIGPCKHNSDVCGTVFLFPKSLTRCPRFFLVFCSKYSLKGIVNVEENHDVMKGDRYLIELVSKFCISNVIGKTFLICLQLF